MAAANISQAQAIVVANGIATFMQAFKALVKTAEGIQTSYADNGVSGVLGAQPTAPYKADGSQDAQDSVPVAGNVILTAGQTVPQSSYNYGAAFVLLQQVFNLGNGSAVATQAGARSLLNAFSPGT